MKKQRLLFFLVLVFFGGVASAKPPVIWVWVGGYLAAPAYVGLGNEMEKCEKPDLIIATCGSSIAAAIYSSFATAEERIAFLHSPEYRDLILQFEPSNKRLTGIAAKIWEILKDWRRLGNRARYPNIYERTLITLPDTLKAQTLDHMFAESHTPVVIVGSQVFDKRKVGMPVGGPMVQEAFFTDPKTAELLKGFESPLAQIAGSKVPKMVKVITQHTILKAVRAAITDLYMINPTSESFAGGMANLLPYDLAHHLAGANGKVIGTYRGDFNPLSEPIMQLLLAIPWRISPVRRISAKT